MIIVIGGPTGSGKTSLAKTIARALQAPIINADAYQVYQGMDIGTNKDKSILKDFQHHGFDILKPNEPFSVKQFQVLARGYIDQYSSQQPIVMVGGTGLYIKATLFDFTFLDHPQNPMPLMSPEVAYARLLEVDPVSAKKIHPHNMRRVLRALAIYDATGETKSSIESKQDHALRYDAMVIGLNPAREKLYATIDARVIAMIDQGLIEEVRALEATYGKTLTAFQAIGYKEVLEFLAGTCSKDQMIASIQMATRRYAKRQWTYFKHQLPTQWFDDEGEAMAWLRKTYGHLFA
jgi:tRNA dimethylallyltransferase